MVNEIKRAPVTGALLFCLVAAAALGAAADPSFETVLVKHALDGDSLVLQDGRQVRLIGINAPEFGKDGEPDQPLARLARTFVANLVEGQRVTLIFDRERRDRYGRTLAHVRLADGRDLEEMVLRQGLVWMVAIPPNVAAVASYCAAEQEARAHARGVWGEPRYAPTAAEGLTATAVGFQRVRGKIRSLRRSATGLEYTLGANISLWIAHEDWKYFASASTDNVAPFIRQPADLVGREVVARGWVRAYNGILRLRLSHPAMLEL